MGFSHAQYPYEGCHVIDLSRKASESIEHNRTLQNNRRGERKEEPTVPKAVSLMATLFVTVDLLANQP